jgi:hypothetical protein
MLDRLLGADRLFAEDRPLAGSRQCSREAVRRPPIAAKEAATKETAAKDRPIRLRAAG